MKPNPFSPLNHFTVPCATTTPSRSILAPLAAGLHRSGERIGGNNTRQKILEKQSSGEASIAVTRTIRRMAVRTVVQRGPKEKKSVAFAVDWPGWSRGA